MATAARHCDELIDRAPDDAEATYLRALVHLRLREFRSAEERARRAVELAPQRPEFHQALGQSCRSQDRLEDAAHHYATALALQADHFESLLGLGTVHALRGRFSEASECYRRATCVRPDAAVAHFNLGRAYEDSGELDKAARCYRQALSIDPALAPAWLNLGGVAAQLGDASSAISAFRRALELRPNYAAAHNNLGTMLQTDGDLDAAIASFREAIRLHPSYAEAYHNLGSALLHLRRDSEARYAFAQALRLDPAHVSARFNLGALSGENPLRPHPDVVRSLFDQYAPRFDAHLVDRLEYRVPEQLVSEISSLRGQSARLDVLDLGCGTGLVGAAIRPLANRVTGVDLSARMLARARSRECYDRLAVEDIVTFVHDEPADSYDVVAAADVFVYLGSLADVFAEIARLLRRGGLFAFSVEALTAQSAHGYQLQPTGRYAHSAEYLKALAQRHGLTFRHLAAASIRKQSGTPVPGWIAVLEK
jgi:predicted TPR repeat methyltransferase